MQGAAHVQEPVSGRGVVPPDGQHLRVQAELRRLLPTRPRAEEKLRANRPPNTPPPPLSPRDAAQPRRAVHSRSPGAGSGRPALPPAEFLEVQVQRQRRLGHARSGSSLPDARCPPPGPPAGQGYTRRRRLSPGEGSGRPSAGTRGGLEEAPAATHLGGAGGPAQVVTGGQAADASTQHDHSPAHWGLGESSGARTGWPGGPCLRKLRGVRAPAAADCFRGTRGAGPTQEGAGRTGGRSRCRQIRAAPALSASDWPARGGAPAPPALLPPDSRPAAPAARAGAAFPASGLAGPGAQVTLANENCGVAAPAAARGPAAGAVRGPVRQGPPPAPGGDTALRCSRPREPRG